MKVSQSNYRYQSDMRQIGGLLMLLSFALVVNPLVGIMGAFGPDGAINTDMDSIPFWKMIADLCMFIIGMSGLTAGYLATVHDWSNKYFNYYLMVVVQTSWIGYITNMTNVGKMARLPAAMNMFVPAPYGPEDKDVRFLGALGVIGVLTYGFASAGAMAFLVWSLNAYTTGEPETRSGDYFRGRINFYGTVLFLGGMVQFLMGSWCLARFDMNQFKMGPVRVAFLVVSYPAMSIFVGLIQLINGLWVHLRARGYLVFGENYLVYQYSLAFQFFCVMVLQNVSQIAYIPADMGAGLSPTLAGFSVGMTLMPGFLDFKMNSLPAMLPKDYYGDSSSPKQGEHTEEVIETAKPAADDVNASQLSGIDV